MGLIRVTVTLLGLAVLRFRHASFDETLEAAAEPAGKDPPVERR